MLAPKQQPTYDEIVERIAAHRIAGASPREEIEWLAAHGVLRRLSRGEVLTARAAGVVEGLFIILSGHVALYVDRANGREKIMEWRGGDVAGLLPYSRLVVPPGNSSAEEDTELVMIRRDELPALIRECHSFTSALVHVMVDRARHFTSNELYAEKMASLGKLSAGLAHELNNPAAAIVRSANSLAAAMTESETASRTLGALSLGSQQTAAIEAVRRQVLSPGAQCIQSPLERADREAELEDWFAARGLEREHAAALADAGITEQSLDQLAGCLDGSQLSAAARWLAISSQTHQLAEEIAGAGQRISSLVNAVKGFTQMDRNATAGPVDIREGLAQTVAICNGKAQAKYVSLLVKIAPGLPKPHGVVAELNQIWANLIDNALDAVTSCGTVTIEAVQDGEQVVICVTDDGFGIPAEIKGKIFDPFFTTKSVGQGTGLGLDMVRRMVAKHRGTISVESEPGCTQFRVALPVAE